MECLHISQTLSPYFWKPVPIGVIIQPKDGHKPLP